MEFFKSSGHNIDMARILLLLLFIFPSFVFGRSLSKQEMNRLFAELESPERGKRNRAVSRLHLLQNPEANRRLFILCRSAILQKRRIGVWALGIVRPSRFRKELKRHLRDRDYEIRKSAYMGLILQSSSSKRSLVLLEKALFDKDSAIRRFALTQLLARNDSLRVFARAVASRNTDIAIIVLSELKNHSQPKKAQRILKKGLFDRRSLVRLIAARHLRKTQPQLALKTLLALSHRKDVGLVFQVIDELALYSDSRAKTRLKKLSLHRRKEVRKAALDALFSHIQK